MTPPNSKTQKQPNSLLTNLKMVLFISDFGNLDSDTEKEDNYGKTEAYTKDTGEIIWLMEKED